MAKSRSSSTSGDLSGSTDGRVGGVKKQCEECGESSPVACRICTSCGFDFFGDKGDRTGNESDCSDPEMNIHGITITGERRRSERVKREKPDYYDALEFENKRKTTPSRSRRGERGGSTNMGRSPKSRDGDRPGRGRPPGRAKLTWKNGKNNHDEDDDDKDKRRRKRPRNRDQEEDIHMMDELTNEKSLQCRFSLSEINRKLVMVMTQPSK